VTISGSLFCRAEIVTLSLTMTRGKMEAIVQEMKQKKTHKSFFLFHLLYTHVKQNSITKLLLHQSPMHHHRHHTWVMPAEVFEHLSQVLGITS
jgi:hypothetical protein